MAGEPSSPHAVFLLDLSESGTTRGDSGFLLKALHESRIRTFTIEDEEELLTPRGDEITPALVTAIQASKIAVVVVTGGYLDVSLGRWKVLTYILDYFKGNPQLIIPVYYVDRRIAHRDLHSFDNNFEKRKKYFEKTGKNVYKLSKDMDQVDALPGWDFDWFENNIDQFNRKIASLVSKMLNRAPLEVAVYPVVGLDSRLEEVWRHLKLTSSNREFLKIGFYKIQEGIHKSTLAGAVYNSIAHLFEVPCFLPDIRQNSNTLGLVGVQKMLLSQISGERETDIQLENVSKGASMIQDMLLKKDVLLILDDVDSLDQLDALGRGPGGWRFSDGSRVIITTQEEGWLADHWNEFLRYDVQELNHKDIQSIQRASTTSTRAEVISQRDFQAEKMWRIVGLMSSVVGLLYFALSDPFKRLIRGWNPFKFFCYLGLSLGICAFVLYAKRSSFSGSRKRHIICYVVFLIIAVYSFYYDKAVDGKPGILSVVSNVAFALVSLSLSKLVDTGFDTGMFCYFLGCFTIQLLTINWKLILVAIIIDCPLFLWHFSSDFRPKVDYRAQTIPLWVPNNQKVTREFYDFLQQFQNLYR